MIGVKNIVTLERTLYLDLPDTTSEVDILKAASDEIILPIDALNKANQVLQQFHINIPKLDLKDWKISDKKYEILK